MNILENKITVLEDDSYFQFSQISEYVTKYSAEEFIKMFLDNSLLQIDKNLDKFIFQGTTPVFVGEKIPSFSIYWYTPWETNAPWNSDGLTWEILELFIYPVYRDKDDGEIFAHDYNLNLWKARFIEDYENLNTYSISTRTDFNEQFGWYPHLEFDNDYIPLSYIGEMLVKDRKAYLFLDINYSSEFFEDKGNHRVDFDNIGLDFDDIYAVIWEDTLELDNNFVKHSLSDFDKNIIMPTDKDEYGNNDNKRLIPYDPIFNFAPLVQDYYGPEIEDLITGEWTFVYQMPIPWHGAKTIDESNLYYINEGDSGSIAVFINANNEFRVEYSQT